VTWTERKLRAELKMLKARYDCYAFAPEIYAVVRQMEIEIGWILHHAARVGRPSESIPARRPEALS
jgi:hypothetical protein